MGLATPFAGEIARFLTRYRWGWALLSIVVSGLGAFIIFNAQPINFVAVSGVVASVTSQGDDTDALRLVGDGRRFLIHPQGYHPVMSALPHPGASMTLWIETDNLIAYAVLERDTDGHTHFYQSDLYEHRNLVQPALLGAGVLSLAMGVCCAVITAFFPKYQRWLARRRKPRAPRRPRQAKLRYVPTYLQDYQGRGYSEVSNPHERR